MLVQVNIDAVVSEAAAPEEKKEVDFFEDHVNSAAPPSPDFTSAQSAFSTTMV